MNREDTVALACAILHVVELPLFIQSLLFQKAKGAYIDGHVEV